MDRALKEIAKELKLIRRELEKSNKLSIDRESDSERILRSMRNLEISTDIFK